MARTSRVEAMRVSSRSAPICTVVFVEAGRGNRSGGSGQNINLAPERIELTAEQCCGAAAR